MKQKKLLFLFHFLFSYSIIVSNTNTFHRYLWANYNYFSGNTDSAYNWYQTLFASHCSPYIYKGYLNFLFGTHQYTKIIELIPSLESKFEKDAEIQLLFALSFMKNNQVDCADARLIKMSTTFKSNSEITLHTTQAYLRRKEPENALLTIDAFLNNSPRKSHNFVFYFLKAQIHIKLNQLDKALENITACLDMHPRFEKGWLLCATLQEQQGEIKKALHGYNTFLELTGHNDAIEKHLFSLLVKHKDNEQITQFHKSYFDQALSLCNKKEYRAALAHINNYLQLQPKNNDALLLKIKLLAHLQQYDQIKNIIAAFTDKSSPLLPKALYLLHHDNIDKKELISLLRTASEKATNNYWFLLYAADLCIRSHLPSDALTLLTQSLTFTLEPSLQSKIYHQIALLHYNEQQYDQMITHLEKGYTLDNTSDYLNNTLAYYWTTKGKNLEKANSFFDKIGDIKRTNPYFIDTHALMFYKKGNYTKAQEMLEPLQQHQNPTILLHLAKVNYKLDQKEKARMLIKQAELSTTTSNEEKKLHKLQLLLAHNE